MVRPELAKILGELPRQLREQYELDGVILMVGYGGDKGIVQISRDADAAEFSSLVIALLRDLYDEHGLQGLRAHGLMAREAMLRCQDPQVQMLGQAMQEAVDEVSKDMERDLGIHRAEPVDSPFEEMAGKKD